MMKPLLLSALAVVLGSAPAAFADIADYMLNINGTTYCAPGTAYFPGPCSNNAGLAAAPGVVSSLGTAFPGGSGLGTVKLTYNPGPGNYFVNFWVFENVNTSNPFDEYGAASGTPGADETWQIDVPDGPGTYEGELGTLGAGTIVGNTAANTLSNTNYVPGTTSNSDLSSCGFFSDILRLVPSGSPANPNCNDATSMAIGLAFQLTPGNEEVVTFTVQSTAPGGFYLSTTDPTTGTTDYFSASAVSQPVGTPPVPEPSSWILLGTASGVFALVRRRWATR